MKDSQHKLSKRNGDASYEDFVNKGYVKEAIVNYIALLGWSPKSNVEKMSLKLISISFHGSFHWSGVITEDTGIAAALSEKTDIDVLLIEKGHVKLDGYPYGFFGGCCGLIENDLLKKIICAMHTKILCVKHLI